MYISCIHQRIVKLPWIPWIWSINCKNPTVLDASTEKMMVFSAMFLTEEIFPGIAFLSLPETYGWGVAIKSRSSVLWSLQDFWEPKYPVFFVLRAHMDSISINAWDLSFSRMRRMEAKETVGPTMNKRCAIRSMLRLMDQWINLWLTSNLYKWQWIMNRISSEICRSMLDEYLSFSSEMSSCIPKSWSFRLPLSAPKATEEICVGSIVPLFDNKSFGESDQIMRNAVCKCKNEVPNSIQYDDVLR